MVHLTDMSSPGVHGVNQINKVSVVGREWPWSSQSIQYPQPEHSALET